MPKRMKIIARFIEAVKGSEKESIVAILQALIFPE
jgi:hypothetical protein